MGAEVPVRGEHSRPWIRVGLVLLTFNQAFPGLWAALAPRSFYDDFPLPGRGWVAAFPPYNDHLTRDLGTLSVCVAIVVAWAALRLEPRFVTIALLSVLTFIVPHTIWHLGHLQPFAVGDIVAQIILDTATLGVALACLRWSWAQSVASPSSRF